MRKLLALMGSITLTATVGAVTVISCGMPKFPIELKIDGEKIGDEFLGDPVKTIVSLFDFLTYHPAKYNNNLEKIAKVKETYGEKFESQNLYALSESQAPKFFEQLTSHSNDGFKEFNITNKVDKLATEDENSGQTFTVVTEKYTDEKLLDAPVVGKTYESYKAAAADESIWKTDEAESKASTNKDKFEEIWEGDGNKNPGIKNIHVIGEGGTDPLKSETLIKTDFTEVEGDGVHEYSGTQTLNYYKTKATEKEPSVYKLSMVDSLYASPINGGIDFEIKYGELGKNSDDETVKANAMGIKTIWMPVPYTTRIEETKTGEGENEVETKTSTILYYWIPYVLGGYTFASTYSDQGNGKNMFADINITNLEVEEIK